MSFGIRVSDGNGIETLGMDDFTLQRLAFMSIPASRTNGSGTRSDYILMDVDGYDPSTCFVTITPRAYATGGQGEGQGYWGCMPTYKDLGGTRIGIITYSNYSVVDGIGDTYNLWNEQVAECVVEVVRVI